MSFSQRSLLSYLSAHAGKKLSIHEIERRRSPAQNTIKRRGKFGKRKVDQSTLELEQSLIELAEFGLIKKNKSQISVKKPFLVEASLSVSRSGIGFAMGSFPSDIVIPVFKRAGANPRDRIMVRLTDKRRLRYEGEVIRISESFTKDFMAKVIEKRRDIYLVSLIDMPDESFAALKIERATEKTRGKKEKIQLNPGSYIVVRLKNQTTHILIQKKSKRGVQKMPYCSLVELSSLEDKEADLKRILLKYSLPLNYPQKALPSEKEIHSKFKTGLRDKRRKNLKGLYTCTIDGDDAKDFDDAISIEKSKNKIIKLYVHIADVSYFVEKDSPIDQEAYGRGNSYYLKPSVLPMLPAILSEEYCSLKPKTKRLAFTCEMDYNLQGDMLKANFYKSIIYIDQRVTYTKAEKEIDQKNSKLKDFWDFAGILKSKRLKKGGLDLDIPENEIILGADGKILGVQKRLRLRSHQLIEEFMLAANISAARFCTKKKIPGIYRVHESMDKTKLESINHLLRLMGSNVQLKNTEYHSLRKAIDSIKERDQQQIFCSIILRSFMQAAYESSPKGHWGLGFEDYAHFTSPIRRYSDLILHRQIAQTFEKKKPFYEEHQLRIMAEHVSQKERIALEAERSMFKLLSIRLMGNYPSDVYSATLIGFNQFGLFITLHDPPIEGFIPLSSFDKSSRAIFPSEYQVVIPKYSKTLMIGAALQVKYIKSDWENMRLIFKIARVS